MLAGWVCWKKNSIWIRGLGYWGYVSFPIADRQFPSVPDVWSLKYVLKWHPSFICNVWWLYKARAVTSPQASAGLSEHCNSYDFHFDQVFGPQVGPVAQARDVSREVWVFCFRFPNDDLKFKVVEIVSDYEWWWGWWNDVDDYMSDDNEGPENSTMDRAAIAKHP